MIVIKLKKIVKIKSIFDFQDLHLETGIIKNTQHYQPKYKSTRRLGDTIVRGVSKKQSNLDNLALCVKIDEKYGILRRPKQLHGKKLIDRIMHSLIGDWLVNNQHKNVALNGWRAFFRQPMMAGLYKNKQSTVKQKGFNKGGIDTGQLYNNIDSIIVKDNKVWGLN